MLTKKNTPSNFLFVLFVAVFTCNRAEAYIDPGAGHIVLQALGVAFFGLLFYIKQIGAFFKRVFQRAKSKDVQR